MITIVGGKLRYIKGLCLAHGPFFVSEIEIPFGLVPLTDPSPKTRAIYSPSWAVWALPCGLPSPVTENPGDLILGPMHVLAPEGSIGCCATLVQDFYFTLYFKILAANREIINQPKPRSLYEQEDG